MLLSKGRYDQVMQRAMTFFRRLLIKPGLIADPSVGDSIGLAEQVLNAFRDQDTVKLRKFLPWPLRVFLSHKRGGQLWSKIRSVCGTPKSFTHPELHEDQFIRTVKTLFTFDRIRLGITVSLLGNSVVGVNMHAPITIDLAPDWTTPPYVDEMNFVDEEVTLRGAIWSKLGGTLSMPKFKGRKPAVLMLPGSGPGDRDISLGANKPFKDLACGLASSGIITLRMDKPLAVILLKTLVTGTVTEYDEYIPGGLAGLKYLYNHPEVDRSQIFVLGVSLGGGVAPRLCAATPYPVAGLISLAGKSKPLVEILASQMAYMQKHFPGPETEYEKERQIVEEIRKLLQTGHARSWRKGAAHKLPIPVPMSYLKDDFDEDPVEIAKKLDLPMLIVQGKDDWQVTMDHFEKWQEGLRSPSSRARATFRSYDDLGHLLIKFKNTARGMLQYDEPGHVHHEVIRDVVQWIQQVVQS